MLVVLALLLTAALATLVLHGFRWARLALGVLAAVVAATMLADTAAFGALATRALGAADASCSTWCSPAILAGLHAAGGVAAVACAVLLFHSSSLRAIPTSELRAPEVRRDLRCRALIVLFGALPASVLAGAVGYFAADTARLNGALEPLWIPIVLAALLGTAGLWIAALGPWRRTARWLIAAGVLVDTFAVFVLFADAPLRTLKRFFVREPGDLPMLFVLVAPLVVGIAMLAGRLRTGDRRSPAPPA